MNLTLRPITDADIPRITQWLNKPHIKRWYEPIDEWLDEIRGRRDTFSWLRHFIVEDAGVPIGFCQYYDCFDSVGLEDWNGRAFPNRGEVFSIDYLIGEKAYLGRGYGKALVRLLTATVFALGAQEIIVDPDRENAKSNGVLKSGGYVFDETAGYYRLSIRPLRPCELPALEEFLYLAVFVPEGVEAPPRDVIFHPGVYVYIENFGEKDDVCLVAEQGGKIIGAAWSRILAHPGKRGYGNIDPHTPELAISVLPHARSKGVGTALLSALFKTLADRGYSRISLSVQKENPALRLYTRVGFERIGENEEDFIMVKSLIKNY